MHPPDRIKTNKKEHYTGSQDLQFLLDSTPGDVSPTPSIWHAEEILALRWPDWASYCRGAPLTTGWWDPAVCHEPFVNVRKLDVIPY
jgi:hypothetical protein